MAEPPLSVRSAKARDLAHRLARRENRSIADIVEQALEWVRTRNLPCFLLVSKLRGRVSSGWLLIGSIVAR